MTEFNRERVSAGRAHRSRAVDARKFDKKRRIRRGSTLIELMGATMVTAIVLVPSMRLLHGVHRISDKLELQYTLEQVCANKIHECMGELELQFIESHQSGHSSDVGHRDVRFAATCSEHAKDGGIPGRLMAVSAIAWHDGNGDGKRQADETAVTLATKFARLKSG